MAVGSPAYPNTRVVDHASLRRSDDPPAPHILGSAAVCHAVAQRRPTAPHRRAECGLVLATFVPRRLKLGGSED